MHCRLKEEGILAIMLQELSGNLKSASAAAHVTCSTCQRGFFAPKLIGCDLDKQLC